VFCEYWTTTIVMEEVAVQCQQWACSDSGQNCITLSMNELNKPTIIFIVFVCVRFLLSFWNYHYTKVMILFFCWNIFFHMERKKLYFYNLKRKFSEKKSSILHWKKHIKKEIFIFGLIANICQKNQRSLFLLTKESIEDGKERRQLIAWRIILWEYLNSFEFFL
jgi:hypothetical protein